MIKYQLPGTCLQVCFISAFIDVKYFNLLQSLSFCFLEFVWDKGENKFQFQ